MRFRRWFAVSLAAGALLVAGVAHGQSMPDLRLVAENEASAEPVATEEITPLEEPVPVRRKKPSVDPYAPIGLRFGGLTVFPSATIGGVASSNIRRAASGAEAGAGLRLKPSLRFESDWVRHSWTGGASGDFIRYLDHGDIASNSADIFSSFRLDIRRGTRAEFDASYNFDQSGLENSNVPASAIGYRDEHLAVASAALIHDLAALQIRAKASATRKIFGDVELRGGGTEDNSDRDYVEPSLALRTTYADPPLFKPFVEVAYEPRFHDEKFDRNGLQRSSDGYAVSAGAAIDDGPIWTGELAVVYLRRDYDDASLASNDVVGLRGNLTWSPTELTRIVFGVDTSLSDSASSNSSGSRIWNGAVDIKQAVRDNIDLLAGAGVKFERGNDGDDVTYDANLGLVWKLGPSLAWTAGYDVTWLDAASSGRSYSDHRITVGITISR